MAALKADSTAMPRCVSDPSAKRKTRRRGSSFRFWAEQEARAVRANELQEYIAAKRAARAKKDKAAKQAKFGEMDTENYAKLMMVSNSLANLSRGSRHSSHDKQVILGSALGLAGHGVDPFAADIGPPPMVSLTGPVESAARRSAHRKDAEVQRLSLIHI